MMMINFLKGMTKGFLACLFLFCLLVSTPYAWAAHEVSQSNITANVLTNTPTQWTSDLTVQWPALNMGTDILNGYIYKWNNSATLLDDTAFNATPGLNDGTVADPSNPIVVKNKADLANLDSGSLLYIHIKTWYLDIGTGQPTYSSDVVYGPFLIDNVAPTGTLRIVDANGADIDSTSNTSIFLKLAAAKDPVTVYLSETTTRPASGAAFSTDMAWELIDKTPGVKTLYAWFADSVGNISTSPATDSFTLLSGVSISPNTATIDLAASATQVFIASGTSATYTWSIISQVPETQGATVAQISGSATGNSVTVQALAKGTFVLQAVPTVGSGTLTSGTITVIQSAKTYNIPLSVGWNLISLPVEFASTATATVLSGIAGKYSIVWGEFNPATSAWKNYNPAKQTNSLTTLGPNKGYWINATEACTLSVTGTVAARGTNLATGWNLIGFAGDADTAITTVLSGIAGKYSIVWGEFNPATSAWKNYNPAKQTNSLNTMGVGKGYWINATQNSTLSY